MRRRRGISVGSVVMVLFSAVVLLASIGVMYGIRQEEGDLAMDAETLLASVNELMLISQRHLSADDASIDISVVTAIPGDATPPPSTIMPAVSSEIAAVVTPTPTNMPSVKRTLTMTFGGSIMMESAIIDGAYDKANERYQYAEIFSGISDAVHADLNIATLENQFTTNTALESDILAPADSMDALTAAGFNGVVLSAENALAGGQAGVAETLSTLQGRGMITVGLYAPEASSRYETLQINGLQIALLSYTDTLSKESKRAVSDTTAQNAMIHLFKEEQALADIASARAQGANVVIAFLHWGTLNATEPSSEQQRIAQTLCDAGADIIIGSHSRAVQHVERLNATTDSAHQTIVAWSLGTLLCEDRDTRAVVSGALLHLQLTYDTATGQMEFSSVEYTPTYAWRQEEDGLPKYRVVQSALPAPDNMIQNQKDIMGRALALIQETMKKGIAVQR